jgi:hypothetical protein
MELHLFYKNITKITLSLNSKIYIIKEFVKDKKINLNLIKVKDHFNNFWNDAANTIVKCIYEYISLNNIDNGRTLSATDAVHIFTKNKNFIFASLINKHLLKTLLNIFFFCYR